MSTKTTSGTTTDTAITITSSITTTTAAATTPIRTTTSTNYMYTFCSSVPRPYPEGEVQITFSLIVSGYVLLPWASGLCVTMLIRAKSLSALITECGIITTGEK